MKYETLARMDAASLLVMPVWSPSVLYVDIIPFILSTFVAKHICSEARKNVFS
jgi:hypothetical protein